MRNMATVATWNGKTFSVDASKVYSFENLTYKAGVKLKEDTSSTGKKTAGQTAKYVQSTEPATMSLEVPLDRAMGVDVQAEAMSWIAMAKAGSSGKFLLGGADVLGVNVLLENCEVSDVSVNGNGVMCSCKLKLSFMQVMPAPAAATSGGKASSGSKKKTVNSGYNGAMGDMRRLEAKGKSASTTKTVIKGK